MKYLPFFLAPIIFGFVMAFIIPKFKMVPEFMKKPLQQICILGGLIMAGVNAGTLLGNENTKMIVMFLFAPIAVISISIWFGISMLIGKKKIANQKLEPTVKTPVE